MIHDFYSGFFGSYSRNYDAFCELHPNDCRKFRDQKPKFWKTVGDEAIFVNRVESHYQIYAYINGFVRALAEYGYALKNNDATRLLDVKGNAWLASFPYPNKTIRKPTQEIILADQLLFSEKDETEADGDPSRFEFMGKGIDYGWRISGNSRPNFCTISPMLAQSLCRAGSNPDYHHLSVPLKYLGVTRLKGVVNNEDYPIIGIPTERERHKQELEDLREGLDGLQKTEPVQLAAYLRKFTQVHDIEEPALKVKPTDDDVPAPKFYRDKFLNRWLETQVAEQARETSLDEGATEAGGVELKDEDIQDVLRDLNL